MANKNCAILEVLVDDATRKVSPLAKPVDEEGVFKLKYALEFHVSMGGFRAANYILNALMLYNENKDDPKLQTYINYHGWIIAKWSQEF